MTAVKDVKIRKITASTKAYESSVRIEEKEPLWWPFLHSSSKYYNFDQHDGNKTFLLCRTGSLTGITEESCAMFVVFVTLKAQRYCALYMSRKGSLTHF